MASQAPGTGLAIFDPKAGAPAHVAQFFDAEGTNIKPRTTVPSLSPEGKVWTISIDGTKTKMQRRNSDGDLEPLATMKVVILDYAKNRGRQYYEGDYDPNNVSAADLLVGRRRDARRQPARAAHRRDRGRARHQPQDQRGVRDLPDGGQGLKGRQQRQGAHRLLAAPDGRDPA
jgi:hypothetical protein